MVNKLIKEPLGQTKVQNVEFKSQFSQIDFNQKKLVYKTKSEGHYPAYQQTKIRGLRKVTHTNLQDSQIKIQEKLVASNYRQQKTYARPNIGMARSNLDNNSVDKSGQAQQIHLICQGAQQFNPMIFASNG